MTDYSTEVVQESSELYVTVTCDDVLDSLTVLGRFDPVYFPEAEAVAVKVDALPLFCIML